MRRIYLPSTGPEDWRHLLADPDKHWKRGYSAMAAALSWEAAQGLPPEIARIIGPEADLLLAIPEHRVALPGGRRDSQCDVFALVAQGGGLVAVAVEAKVAEPFGPTVAEWMARPTPGRVTRLQAIADLLGCPLPPGELRYQLFHRTAAAVLEARRFHAGRAAMIVQSFSAAHQWYEDFAAFCGFLGLEPARGQPLDRALPGGLGLTLGWATGAAAFV